MNIKKILESLLFVNEKPIDIKELVSVLTEEKKDIISALEELSLEYSERGCGISIVKVAGGYQMCSHPDNAEWVKKMFREKNKQKLSGASLETVAIIAYKQPITRTEIEAIRGVNSDGVVRHLLAWGLVKEAGRKEVPGRPFLYITTRKFLEYFGLNSLKDLPCLEEFSDFSKELEKENIDQGQEQTPGPETVQPGPVPEEKEADISPDLAAGCEDDLSAEEPADRIDAVEQSELGLESDTAAQVGIEEQEPDPDKEENIKTINPEG